MASLNVEAPEYTPLSIVTYPPSQNYTIHHCYPTSSLSIHHNPRPPFLCFFPPVNPYYYYYTHQLQLAPPLPAVPPLPVTLPAASVLAPTHKHFDAGPSRGVFDRKRNFEPVTMRPSRTIHSSSSCQIFQKRERLGKHQVIPLRYFQKKTSVMIKNIPYHYTREMVVEFLDKHCAMENEKAKSDCNGDATNHIVVSAYDFLYLPMDFEKKRSRGYAFVNFTHYKCVWRFFVAFHNKSSVFLGSTKNIKVVSAKVQGKEGLVRWFESTVFKCESEEFLPVWFSPARDGSGRAVKYMIVGKCGTATRFARSLGN